MKRIRIPLLVVVLFKSVLTFSAVNDTANQVTKMIVCNKDTTFRYDYFYNASGQKVLETCYYQDNSSWQRLRQTEWIYQNGTCMSQIERSYSQNQWQTVSGILYSYVSDKLAGETDFRIQSTGDTLFTTKQLYNVTPLAKSSVTRYRYSNSIWIPVFKTRTTDIQLFRDTTYWTLCDQSGNDSVTIRFLKTYNPQLSALSSLQQQLNQGIWGATTLCNWYYKADGKTLLTQRYKSYTESTGVWENMSRTDYEYNANLVLNSETNYHWNGLSWESELKYEYVTDASGNRVQQNILAPVYKVWRKLISIDYSDFNNGAYSKMTSTYNFWGGKDGEQVSSDIPFVFNGTPTIRNAKSIELSYSQDNSTGLDLIAQPALLTVFPNPSDGVFYLDAFNGKVLNWTVTDLSGRILKTSSGTLLTGVVDITDMPRGIYMLKAGTTSGFVSKKLIRK